VNLTELGYNFKLKTGKVIPELLILKQTDSDFSNLTANTSADKVIQHCFKNSKN